ncbi:hypothetical protein GYMLUDRAFT_922416 [Collybiopsis luxurians FD-317 M1]|uniref:Uncharacterized protein n=1 Tax=Collybiopsis luxurians FD-317 M1 TaxID=944289 RepID=A0A0D0CG59_9AGAR|nr:hypothetical protein GYMLUDRAFT_922416 [Collybiopsis luxurians FD-317 M1]
MFADTVITFESELQKIAATVSYTGARIIMPVGLFSTNVIATSLIAIKTWEFFGLLKQAETEERGRIKHLTEVLLLLVESGCLYCLVWVIVLLDVTTGFSPGAKYMLTTIVPHLSGIYPCLIVLLICFKKRSYDTIGTPSGTAWSTNPYISSSRL